jgi:hypothetical protein
LCRCLAEQLVVLNAGVSWVVLEEHNHHGLVFHQFQCHRGITLEQRYLFQASNQVQRYVMLCLIFLGWNFVLLDLLVVGHYVVGVA